MKRKSAAFPYFLLTSTFSGFAPCGLAGAFRGHSLVCPANGSSPLLARPASVTEPADVDVEEATSQAQKLAEIVHHGLTISQPPAVLVTALPCSDRYAADWRGPQTQRRYSCGSPSQKFYPNSQCARDFLDRGRIDRVTQHVCGRHGRRVSAPALLGDWLFDGPSPLGRSFRILHY